MNREAIQRFVVSKTARGIDRDDILYQICETQELNWSEAEELVDKILSDKPRQ